MLPAVVNLPLPSSTAAEPSEANSAMAAGAAPTDVDLERRFGGLRRLLGDAGYRRVRAARVAVVGLGGVGSWAAEALARSGVAGLVLIDLDHVSESNINRQVQALGSTLAWPRSTRWHGASTTSTLAAQSRRSTISSKLPTGRRCCRIRLMQ